ncbi:MAG: RNA polymerase sigma factor [Thermoleophilia bacterium]
MIEDADAPLVARARGGSAEAASALARAHWRSAWRVARGITGDDGIAEDVVQESLVAALRGLDRFDPRRGTFAAWLHRITVNRAIGEVRRRRRRPTAPEEDGRDAVAADPPPGSNDAFLDAVAELKPDHRAVVVLRYGLDYTPTEIAGVLDLPVGTVNSRLARALTILRETMESPHVR